MKQLVMGVLALLVIGMAGTARADLDEKDVAKLMKSVQEGKAVSQRLGSYPNAQLFSFEVNYVNYLVDPKAQICMAATGQAVLLVPCKSLKKGYPLIAPLITWDD